MEPAGVIDKASGKAIPGLQMCPTWAGGNGKTVPSEFNLDGDWTLLNFTVYFTMIVACSF